MKKAFSIIAVAVMVTFIACGPSAEEKAKIEEQAKLTADSIQKALEKSLSTSTEAAPVDSAAKTAETATVAPAEEKH